MLRFFRAEPPTELGRGMVKVETGASAKRNPYSETKFLAASAVVVFLLIAADEAVLALTEFAAEEDTNEEAAAKSEEADPPWRAMNVDVHLMREKTNVERNIFLFFLV